MELTVNGETRVVDEGATVADLIVSLGLSDAICAAEVNKEVVARAERDGVVLREGDVVEVVTLVGGG